MFTTQTVRYEPKDADGNAVTPSTVTCYAVAPSTEATPVTLTESNGVWTGTWNPQEKGSHRVVVEAEFPNDTVELIETQVSVR